MECADGLERDESGPVQDFWLSRWKKRDYGEESRIISRGKSWVQFAECIVEPMVHPCKNV